MLHLNQNSILYVVAGFGSAGGNHSLHQLVHFCREAGVDARIVYLNYRVKPRFDEADLGTQLDVTPRFSKYNVRVDHKIEDSPNNVLLLPEFGVAYRVFNTYPKIQKVMWWLGVQAHGRGGKHFDFRDRAVLHLAQGPFVERFLRRQNAVFVQPLVAPMDNNYLSAGDSFEKSASSIAYNPIKGGAQATAPLVDLAPDLKWRSMAGMSAEEIGAVLAESRVYLDLGEFPGRERMPREAVLSRCCCILAR